MKSNKQHSRASQKIPAPFMPPMKRSAMVAKEVEKMLQDHILRLGEFAQSLGIGADNISEFIIETRSVEDKIEYTFYSASDRKTPLGSKII